MDRLYRIIRKKHGLYLQVSLLYALVMILFRWGFKPTWDTALFLAGSFTGVYFLDAAEEIFALSSSPFRSILFSFGLAFVGLFIVTSSGSMFASGLVLLLHVTVAMRLIGEYRLTGSLSSWYLLLARVPGVRAQRSALLSYIGLFVLSSILFIRS